MSKLTVEVWEGDPDRPVDHPDNVKLTELVLSYPQRSQAEDGVFDLEYTYSKEGLLAVKATLQKTGEVLLDGEVKVFGDGTVPPEIQSELKELLALRSTRQTAPKPTHPQQSPAAPRDGRTADSGAPVPAPSPAAMAKAASARKSPRR